MKQEASNNKFPSIFNLDFFDKIRILFQAISLQSMGCMQSKGEKSLKRVESSRKHFPSQASKAPEKKEMVEIYFDDIEQKQICGDDSTEEKQKKKPKFGKNRNFLKLKLSPEAMKKTASKGKKNGENQNKNMSPYIENERKNAKGSQQTGVVNTDSPKKKEHLSVIRETNENVEFHKLSKVFSVINLESTENAEIKKDDTSFRRDKAILKAN